MHDYAALTDDDLNTIVRLLGDLAASTAPLADKRIALLEGVARLIRADIWAWAGTRMTPDGGFGPIYLHDGGYASAFEQQQLIYHSSKPIVWEAVMDQFDGREVRALAFDPARRKHASIEAVEYVAYACRQSGIQHLLYFTYPLDDTTTTIVTLHRRFPSEPYTPREPAIVQLVFGQIEWLHRAGTDVPANDRRLDELTPRLREALIYLLAGRSRKEIASVMNVSTHTVNDYCKEIFTRFSASSVTELLANFIGRRPG